MQVILLQDVKNVGKKDQVVSVSDGYATNFLLARKLAVKATDRSLEVRDAQIEKRKEEQAALKAEAEKTAERLKEIVLEFKAPSSKDGRMFGTISEKEIVNELKNKYGISLDKRKFVDTYPVNAFGYSNLKIEIFKGVFGTIKVHVSEKK